MRDVVRGFRTDVEDILYRHGRGEVTDAEAREAIMAAALQLVEEKDRRKTLARNPMVTERL